MADYLLAQSSVLGSMLISPQIVGDVMTNLQPEDFTEPMGQEVFLAIRALHLAGEKIDPVCVLNQMGGGGLTVRSRDSYERKILSWHSIEVSRKMSHCLARVVNEDEGNIVIPLHFEHALDH